MEVGREDIVVDEAARRRALIQMVATKETYLKYLTANQDHIQQETEHLKENVQSIQASLNILRRMDQRRSCEGVVVAEAEERHGEEEAPSGMSRLSELRDRLSKVRMWRGQGASSVFPEMLFFVSERCFAECTGNYQMTELSANDYPVWRQLYGPHYLYCDGEDKLIVADAFVSSPDSTMTDGKFTGTLPRKSAMPQDVITWECNQIRDDTVKIMPLPWHGADDTDEPISI